MRIQTSEHYISNRAWLRDVVGEKDLILRGVSALEYLQLFVGYAGEETVEVYSLQRGAYENIDYRVVDSFKTIETVRYGNVLCASANQTFNDMLAEYETADELALTEALSKYYHANGETFDGLRIKPENAERFKIVREWAIRYFSGG